LLVIGPDLEREKVAQICAGDGLESFQKVLRRSGQSKIDVFRGPRPVEAELEPEPSQTPFAAVVREPA
jgi:hypothetical protein